MKDTELREKIERVDALAGGVIYGKEEAWEKLQSRLDKPAAKIIPLRRKLAAAAAVLLLLSAGTWFLLKDKEETTHIAALPSNPASASPAAVVANTIAPTPVTPLSRNQARSPETQLIKCKDSEETSLPHPDDRILSPNIALVSANDTRVEPLPTPLSPAKKMRTVHINDLGKAEPDAPTEIIVYSGPALDISKMKVVSVYDIQLQDQLRRRDEEIITIARLNRPRTPWHYGSNRQFALTPLTISLNRKN